MGVSKVIYGNRTLIDLTSDSVTSKNLLKGVTAHNKAGNSITGEYVRPMMIHGRVVKQIFCPTIGNDWTYACYGQERVQVEAYGAGTSKASCDATFDCFHYDGWLWDNPKEGSIKLGTFKISAGGSETSQSLVFQMPSTKYGGSIAATTLMNAEAKTNTFGISIMKLNDRAYLLIYMKSYDTEYTKCTGMYWRIIYDTGTQVLLTGGTGMTSGWTDTAAISYSYYCTIFTLNKDNTQLGIFRDNYGYNGDTGAVTQDATYYNNYRVRSPSTIGLRSTTWTNIYNNAAYSIYAETVMPEVGYYIQYYTNVAGTADARYFMCNVMGDWYGAQVNATSSLPNYFPATGYGTVSVGGFINDEDYIYMRGFTLSNGIVKTTSMAHIAIGKHNRLVLNTSEAGSSNVQLLDLSTLATICKPIYDNRTASTTKIAFVKFIDHMLIIGISILKDIHSVKTRTFSSVEDNVYAIGLYYNLDYNTFQVVGAARAGSFKNDNFLGFSKGSTSTRIGDCFEHDSNTVFDQGYDFETNTRFNRTYADIKKNWEYDPFRQYVIEYRDATGGQQN